MALLVSRIVPVPDLESTVYRRSPAFLWWEMVFLDCSVAVRDLYFMTIIWILTVVGNICLYIFQEIYAMCY